MEQKENRVVLRDRRRRRQFCPIRYGIDFSFPLAVPRLSGQEGHLLDILFPSLLPGDCPPPGGAFVGDWGDSLL